jgi:hypothetical protein
MLGGGMSIIQVKTARAVYEIVVDDKEIITEAAPIAQKWVGKPAWVLKKWLENRKLLQGWEEIKRGEKK